MQVPGRVAVEFRHGEFELAEGGLRGGLRAGEQGDVLFEELREEACVFGGCADGEEGLDSFGGGEGFEGGVGCGGEVGFGEG